MGEVLADTAFLFQHFGQRGADRGGLWIKHELKMDTGAEIGGSSQYRAARLETGQRKLTQRHFMNQ